MSNDHPYTDQGLRWKSSEAQYQAMRYPAHPDVQEMIRAAPNAYAAKLVAYEHLDKTRAEWKDVNVQAMAYVDRKRVVKGKSGSVRVAISGCGTIINKKKTYK